MGESWDNRTGWRKPCFYRGPLPVPKLTLYETRRGCQAGAGTGTRPTPLTSTPRDLSRDFSVGYHQQVSVAGHSGLPKWSQRLISELGSADLRAAAVANGLSPEQMNWQPVPGAWSIAQCIAHLHLANEVYLPAIAAALDGHPQSKVEEITLGWPSRWFIRNFIAPNPSGTRAKAPKKIDPANHIDPQVVSALQLSNQVALELVRRASLFDVNGIRFKNPFVPLLRFTVGTGLEIVVKHESRHLLQAERVRRSAGFPR
jgi:DinB superfamily